MKKATEEKRPKTSYTKPCCDNCVRSTKFGSPEAYSIRCNVLDKRVFKSDCCSKWSRCG